MNGVLLVPFGGNAYTSDTGPSAPDIDSFDPNLFARITMTAAEAMFWYTRVNEINIEWDFERESGGSISGSYTMPKALLFPGPDGEPANSASTTEDGIPKYVLQYGSGPDPSTFPGDLRWFISRIQGDIGNDNIWRTVFSPTVSGVDFFVDANPSLLYAAGTAKLLATDPVTGALYSNSVVMRSGLYEDITGELTITPLSYYPWTDPDNGPYYDTATGTIL